MNISKFKLEQFKREKGIGQYRAEKRALPTITQEEANKKKAEFIARHGITQCPPSTRPEGLKLRYEGDGKGMIFIDRRYL